MINSYESFISHLLSIASFLMSWPLCKHVVFGLSKHLRKSSFLLLLSLSQHQLELVELYSSAEPMFADIYL